MAAGYPPDFSAHPSVARIQNKIKQMYVKGNVDRLFFSVILIFLSTAFSKNKKKPQESLWLPIPVNDTVPLVEKKVNQLDSVSSSTEAAVGRQDQQFHQRF